jgi:prepilin-type N-terminal cleavage/methylation domain-containing protein
MIRRTIEKNRYGLRLLIVALVFGFFFQTDRAMTGEIVAQYADTIPVQGKVDELYYDYTWWSGATMNTRVGLIPVMLNCNISSISYNYGMMGMPNFQMYLNHSFPYDLGAGTVMPLPSARNYALWGGTAVWYPAEYRYWLASKQLVYLNQCDQRLCSFTQWMDCAGSTTVTNKLFWKSLVKQSTDRFDVLGLEPVLSSTGGLLLMKGQVSGGESGLEQRLANVSRAGFTVLELLACVAIAALLMSLIGAAVMSARESARKMQCLSHLKQIGLATANYESTHGLLPCSGVRGFRYLAEGLEGRSGSWHFSGYIDECLNGPCPEIGEWKRPPVYLCPSDPLTFRTLRGFSYRFSSGMANLGGSPGVTDGLGIADIDPKKMIGFRDVTDGLSMTAMTSEQLLPPSTVAHRPEDIQDAEQLSVATRDAHRYHWEIPTAFTLTNDLNSFLTACDTQFGAARSHNGGWWFNELSLSYDHVRAPNTRSCVNGTFQAYSGLFIGPVSPPNSLHRGGVNLIRCDGSGLFISNGVDTHVWQAIGTRNGGESNGLTEWVRCC